LASVATDILGKSGRAMVEALVHGTTDPAILADLARGRLRAKLPALRQALAGHFRPHHAFVVGQILAHLDYLDEAIGALRAPIAEHLAAFEAAATLLDALPGVARRTAENLIAEIGVDMTQFPSDRHLASWAGVSSGAPRRAPELVRETPVGSEPFRIDQVIGGEPKRVCNAWETDSPRFTDARRAVVIANVWHFPFPAAKAIDWSSVGVNARL